MAARPEYGTTCSCAFYLSAAGMIALKTGPTPEIFCRTRNPDCDENAGQPETECRDENVIAIKLKLMHELRTNNSRAGMAARARTCASTFIWCRFVVTHL